MNNEELRIIAEGIAENITFLQKEVLTSEETAKYLGLSKSCLYKLTMRRAIPHYKPNGKLCYFRRKELDEWLISNRVATDEELEARAIKKGGKR